MGLEENETGLRFDLFETDKEISDHHLKISGKSPNYRYEPRVIYAVLTE